MPIKVQSDLPVRAILERENIFVMDETRALNQDIRPLKIGILNRAYDLLAWTSIPTRAARPCAEVVADIGQAAKALLRDNGYTCADCIGVGIGSPGTVDSQSGIVLYSNNIRWEQVPLAAMLNKYIPVPVFAIYQLWRNLRYVSDD